MGRAAREQPSLWARTTEAWSDVLTKLAWFRQEEGRSEGDPSSATPLPLLLRQLDAQAARYSLRSTPHLLLFACCMLHCCMLYMLHAACYMRQAVYYMPYVRCKM